MNKAEHTPGPWLFHETWRFPFGKPVDGEKMVAGKVFWGYHITGSNEDGGMVYPVLGHVCNFPDNMEANARLIAAAPDMLEALQAIANGEGVYGAQAHEYKQIARKAIAKATGGDA